VSGVSTTAEGRVTFSSAAPFDIYQPQFLPSGFVLAMTESYSGVSPDSGVSQLIASERVRQAGREIIPSEMVKARMEVYEAETPSVLFLYLADPQTYLLLFQRAAQPGETLPEGESRVVNGQPATLRYAGERRSRGAGEQAFVDGLLAAEQVLILTWIEEGTWLTLESNLPEEEILHLAENLVKTQPGGEQVGPIEQPATPFFCNPEDEPPNDGLLLGNVAGERYWGGVWINLIDTDLYPERVSYGISLPDVTPADLYQRGLEALQDPNLRMTHLPYPSISYFSSETIDSCLMLPTDLQGYIVIEVWDETVNVGFGGEGDRLIERAMLGLENELEQTN